MRGMISSDPAVTSILRSVRDGDGEALGELLEHDRPYVRAIVRAMSVGRAGVAESDLIQDSLIQAVASARSFQGETYSEWVAWLRTIVVRTTQRTLGRVGVPIAAGDGGLAATFVKAPGPGPGDEAVLRERSAQIAIALAALPDEMQFILQLRVVEGLDHGEIAKRTGRSCGAARMLYLRSLRQLHAAWMREFGDE
jgi:RNA polymerase sigma-70 factor (ECF subfamily)